MATKAQLRTQWKYAVKHVEIMNTHRVLYCLLCGSDPSKIFVPITNQKKINNGQQPYLTIASSLALLKYIQVQYNAAILSDGRALFKIIQELLRPFNTIVTVDDILNLDIPSCDPDKGFN